MHRFGVLLSMVAVALLGMIALDAHSVTVAQDTTPAAGELMDEGVSFVPVGFAAGVTLPSPADLIAVRVTVEPGASSSLVEQDPTGGLLFVESGAFSVRVDADWTVTRGVAIEEAMTAPEGDVDMTNAIEAVASGQDVTLAAGDVAYIPGSVNGELRNDGQEPAVGLLVLIAQGGMIPTEPLPAETPAG